MMPVQAFFPADQYEAVTLAATSNAVPLARRLVAEVTRHWRLPADLRQNAELITSELATNALKATRAFHEAMGFSEIGCIKLRLRWADPNLVTEVWDINPVLPVRREADAYDTGGRGLEIIDFLCHRWDAVRCRNGGKLVWGEQRMS